MNLNLHCYGFTLAAYALTVLIIFKLFIFLMPRVDNSNSWLLEMYYRQFMRYSHERGRRVWAGINDHWLFTDPSTITTFLGKTPRPITSRSVRYFKPPKSSIDPTFQYPIFHPFTTALYTYICLQIWILLLYILAFQHVFTVYGMVDVFNWNNVMNQIVVFHEKYPNVTRPTISPEVLSVTSSYMQTYLADSMYIIVLVSGALLLLDLKFEDWLRGPRGELVLSIQIVFLLVGAGCIDYVFSTFVLRCIQGQNVLYQVLAKDG